ncbi:MAG: leucyl aminopeptidase [Sedimentisphaerales bacterium]|nr:leucyl aminopeptidase [Sedimentisphaerales bacterium]
MARSAKKTTVTAKKFSFPQARGDMLVIGIYKDTKKLPQSLTSLDKTADLVLSSLLKMGDFSGNANETALLYPPSQKPCKRILAIGLGERKSLSLNTLRQAAGTAARNAQKLKTPNIALALHTVIDSKIDLTELGQAVAEGAIIGRYNFEDYLPPQKDKNSPINNLRITVIDPLASAARKISAGCRIGTILANSQNISRIVDNKPGNEINPPSLARHARLLARQYSLQCKIYDDKQLTTMKMNGILAVGSGSANKPRLIMLKHQGRRANNKSIDAVIVGKAITFDSGGISIKPSANMEAMKFDKSGGCNVLGIMAAVAQLKLPLNVIGLIPSAENLPSHTSYRPGDIIRTYSGKTVEIQNTDAEGRMILCDALAYAAKMKPAAIIDMATLTGACVVALGEHHAGLFSNNSALQKQLEKASQRSGEPVWALPSGDEYLEQMKSKIADLKNISGREGGACTAAAFLGAFVEDVPWAHIDIAGTSDTEKEKSFRAVGATGFAVRLIVEYLNALK